MPLFRKRPESLPRLLEQRAHLVAELAQVDEDAAWTAASDDRAELAESSQLRKQADALRRALADLDARIAAAADR